MIMGRAAACMYVSQSQARLSTMLELRELVATYVLHGIRSRKESREITKRKRKRSINRLIISALVSSCRAGLYQCTAPGSTLARSWRGQGR